MVRRKGADKIYFASTAPPIRFPCVYGIDMQTRSEFIARNRTPEQVAELLGADKVIYQDLDDLKTAVLSGNPALSDSCAACFCGDYPTKDVTPEIEHDRLMIGDRPRAREAVPIHADR